MKIYRLITRNSYEREMFDKASLKLGLDKAVLQSMSGRENANSGVQQLSKKEIEDLLRKGAYGALMDEEDEGSKFCEEDIDQILQRRTHTITIESEGKGSTFAKVTRTGGSSQPPQAAGVATTMSRQLSCLQASFVATGNRTDISLEDPDFWQKWAKKAELDLDAINGRVANFSWLCKFLASSGPGRGQIRVPTGSNAPPDRGKCCSGGLGELSVKVLTKVAEQGCVFV